MVLTPEAAEARLVTELRDAAAEADFLTEAELTDPNQFASAVLNNLPAIAYALHVGLPAIGWKGATKNGNEDELVLRAMRQWTEQARLLLLALVAGAVTLETFYERMANLFRTHTRNAFVAGKRAMGNLTPLSRQDITLLDDTTADDGLRLDRFLQNPAAAGGLGGMLLGMVTDPSNFLGSGLPGDPFAGLPPPLGAGKGKEHVAKDLGKYANRIETYADRIRAMGPVGEMAALADIPGDATLVWWTLGGQDHCVDCLALSDMSPFYGSALSLSGISPGSGHTRCGVKCKCNLEYDVPSVVCADIFGTGTVGLTPEDLLESADGTRINVWIAEASACANPVNVENFASVATPMDAVDETEAYSWAEDVTSQVTRPVPQFTMAELRALIERRIVQRDAGLVVERGLVADPEAFAAAMRWLEDVVGATHIDNVRIATYELEGATYHAASTRTSEAIRFEVGHTTSGLPVLESDFTLVAMRDLAEEARLAGLRFEVNGITSNEGMVAWLDTLGANRYEANAALAAVAPNWDQQLRLTERVRAGISPEPSFILPEVNALPAWPELSLLADETPEALAAIGGTEAKRLLVDPTGQRWLFKPGAGYERDAAAARLSQRLGLRTPPISVVEYDGVKGSLQPIIANAETVGRLTGAPGFPDELAVLAGQEAELAAQGVLDYIIGNVDSHADNLLMADGQLWAIDRSRGFIGAAATSSSARQFHAGDLFGEVASERGYLKVLKPTDLDPFFNRLDGLTDQEFLDIIGPETISQVVEPFGTEADKAARLLKRKADVKATHEQMFEELVDDAYDRGWSIGPEWEPWTKAGSHFGGNPIVPTGQPARALPAPPKGQPMAHGIATAEAAGTAGNDLAVASVGFTPPPSRYLALGRLEAALPMTKGNILEGFDLAQLNAITDRAEVLGKMGVDMTILTRLGDFSKVPAADRELGIGLTYKNKIALDGRHEWTFLGGVDSPDTVYNDIGGLFAHEYGHVLVNSMDAEGQLALIELFKANVAGAADLSTYAKADLQEWAGEVLAAISTPGYVPGTLAYDEAFWTVMVADNKVKALTKDGLPGPMHQMKVKAPDPKAIPTGELTQVQNLGGSTGATLVKDSEGARFVDKRGNSPEHLREEVTADAAYRAMGLPVPRAILFETPAGPLKRAAFVDNAETLATWWGHASEAEKAAMRAQLQAGMAMDALIGNWDVIGLAGDNILVTKGGRAIRVDNGGSFRYRAQGALKDHFGADVTELSRYRDVAKNTWTTRIFGGTTDTELRRQILVLDDNREALLLALPEELRAVTGARLDNMLEATAKVEPAPAKAGLWNGPPPPPKPEAVKVPRATEPVGPPIATSTNAWGPGDPQQYLVGDSPLPLNAPAVQWSGVVPPEPPLPDLGATKAAKEAALLRRDEVTKTWQDVAEGKAQAAFSWRAADAKEAKDAGLTVTKVGKTHVVTKGPEDAKPFLDYVESGGKTGDDAFWHLMGYSDADLAAYDAYDELGKSLRLSAGVLMVEPDGRMWVLAPKNKFGGYENTVIKGGVDEGETAAAGAVREMMEEAGFSVELDAYLGDYVNDTKAGITRMYVGHRTGGGPLWAHEKETYKVRLLTADEARAALKQYGKPNERDQSILADAVAALEGKPGAPVFTIPVEDLPEFVSKTAPGRPTLGPGAHDGPKKAGPLAGIAPQPGPNPPLPTAFGYNDSLIAQLYGHQVEYPPATKFPYAKSIWTMPDGTAQQMFWQLQTTFGSPVPDRIFWANAKKQVEDPHLRLTLHVAQLRNLSERLIADPALTALRVNEQLLAQVPKLREMLVAAGGTSTYGKYIELSRQQVSDLLKGLKSSGPLPVAAPLIPSAPLIPVHVSVVPGTLGTVEQADLASMLDTVQETLNPPSLTLNHTLTYALPSGMSREVDWYLGPSGYLHMLAHTDGLAAHEATALMSATLLHLEPLVAKYPELHGITAFPLAWAGAPPVEAALLDFAHETASQVGGKWVWEAEGLTKWADQARAGLKGEGLSPAGLLGPTQAIPLPPAPKPVAILDPSKLPEAKTLIHPDDYPAGLSSGVSSKVVLQDPSTGTYYLFKEGQGYDREIAAQALARDLGFNVPAIKADEYAVGAYGAAPGSLQAVIPNVHTVSSMGAELEDAIAAMTPAQMNEMAAQSMLDFITWNVDTHSSNWLVDDAGKLWGIDRNGALELKVGSVPSDDVRTFYSEATKNPGGWALMRQAFDDPVKTGLLDKVGPADIQASVQKVMALSDAHITATLKTFLADPAEATSTQRVLRVLDRRAKVADGYGKAFAEMVDKLGVQAPPEWRSWREAGAHFGDNFAVMATSAPSVTVMVPAEVPTPMGAKKPKWTDTPSMVKDLETRYPGAEFGDLAKLDYQLTGPLMEELDSLFERFGPIPSFKGVRAESGPQTGKLAEVKRLVPGVPGSAVILPSWLWADAAQVEKHWASEVKALGKSFSGLPWSVTGKALTAEDWARGILTHEMGHEYMGLSLHARFGLKGDPIRAKVDSWFESYLKTYKTDPLTKYGTSNPHEAWAEAFAAAIGPTPLADPRIGELRTILEDYAAELAPAPTVAAAVTPVTGKSYQDFKVGYDGPGVKVQTQVTATVYAEKVGAPQASVLWRRNGNDLYLLSVGYPQGLTLHDVATHVDRMADLFLANPKLAYFKMTSEAQAALLPVLGQKLAGEIAFAAKPYAGGIALDRKALLQLRDQLAGDATKAVPLTVVPEEALPIPSPEDTDAFVAALAGTAPVTFEPEDVSVLSDLATQTKPEGQALLDAVAGSADLKVTTDGYALTKTIYPVGAVEWRRLGNNLYVHHANGADAAALKAQVIRFAQTMDANPVISGAKFLDPIVNEMTNTGAALSFYDLIKAGGGVDYPGGVKMTREQVLALRDQLVGSTKAVLATPPVAQVDTVLPALDYAAAGKLKPFVSDYIGKGDYVSYADQYGVGPAFIQKETGSQLHVVSLTTGAELADAGGIAHIGYLADLQASKGAVSAVVLDKGFPKAMGDLFVSAGATTFDDGSIVLSAYDFDKLAISVKAEMGHTATEAALASAPILDPTIHQVAGADAAMAQFLKAGPVDISQVAGDALTPAYARTWTLGDHSGQTYYSLDTATGNLKWTTSTGNLNPVEAASMAIASLDHLADLLDPGSTLTISSTAIPSDLRQALKAAGAQPLNSGLDIVLDWDMAKTVVQAIEHDFPIGPLPVGVPTGIVTPVTPPLGKLSGQLGYSDHELKQVSDTLSSDSFNLAAGTLTMHNPVTLDSYDHTWGFGAYQGQSALFVHLQLAGMTSQSALVSGLSALPILAQASKQYAEGVLVVAAEGLPTELLDLFAAIGAKVDAQGQWRIAGDAMDSLITAISDDVALTPVPLASAAAAVPLPKGLNPHDHIPDLSSEELGELIGKGNHYGAGGGIHGTDFDTTSVIWSEDGIFLKVTGIQTPNVGSVTWTEQTAVAFIADLPKLFVDSPKLTHLQWALPASPGADAVAAYLKAAGGIPAAGGSMVLGKDAVEKAVAGIQDAVGLPSDAALVAAAGAPTPSGLIEAHNIDSVILGNLPLPVTEELKQGFGKVIYSPPGSEPVIIKTWSSAKTLRWVSVSGNANVSMEAGVKELIEGTFRKRVAGDSLVNAVWFDRIDQMPSMWEDMLRKAGAVDSGDAQYKRLAMTRTQFLKLGDQLTTDLLAGATKATGPVDVAALIKGFPDAHGFELISADSVDAAVAVGWLTTDESSALYLHFQNLEPMKPAPAMWSLPNGVTPDQVAAIQPYYTQGKLPIHTYVKGNGQIGHYDWKDLKAQTSWLGVGAYGSAPLDALGLKALSTVVDAAVDGAKPLFIASEVVDKVPWLKTEVIDKFGHLGPSTPLTNGGYVLSARDVSKLKLQLDNELVLGAAPTWPGAATAAATPPPAALPPIQVLTAPPVAAAPGPSLAVPAPTSGLGASYGYDASKANAMANESQWTALKTHESPPEAKFKTVSWADQWQNGTTIKWAEEQQGGARILRVRSIAHGQAFSEANRAEAFVAAVTSRWQEYLLANKDLERFVVDKKAIEGLAGVSKMLADAGFKETKEYWVITRDAYFGKGGFMGSLYNDAATWTPSSTIPSSVPAQVLPTPPLPVAAAPTEPAVAIVVGPAVAPIAPATTGTAAPSFIYGYSKPDLDKAHASLADTALPADAKGATPHKLTAPGGVEAEWSVSPSGKTVGWSTLAVPAGVSSQAKVNAAFAQLRRIAGDMENRDGFLWVRPEVYDQVPGMRQMLLDVGGKETSFAALQGTAIQMSADQAKVLVAALDGDVMTGLAITVKDVAGYLGFDPLAIEKVFAQEPHQAAGRFTWNIGGKQPSNLIKVKGTEAHWTGVANGDDTTRALAAMGQLTWFVDHGIDDLVIDYDAYAAIPKLDKLLIGAGATVQGTALHLDAEALNTARKLIARDRLPVLLGGDPLPYSIVDELVAKGPDVVAAATAETIATTGLRTKAAFEVAPGIQVTMGYTKSDTNIFWQSAEAGTANLGQARAAVAAQLHSFADQIAQSAGVQRLDISASVLKEHPNLRTVLRKYGAKEVPPSGATEGYLTLNRTQVGKLRHDLDKELAGFAPAGSTQTYIGQQAALIVWPTADDLTVSVTTAQAKAKLGGQTAKAIFADKTGAQWLFKPGASGRGAVTDTAAAKLAELLGLNVPPVKTYTLMVDGKLTTGSLQKMLPKAKGMREAGIATAGQLNVEQTRELMRHSILDWVIANDDAHMGNWLIDENGKLWSIDKSRGWESFGGRQDILSTASNGNGGGKPWLFQFWADAKKDPSILGKLKPQDLAVTLRKLRDLPDSTFEQLVKGVAPLTRNPKYAGKPAQMVADMLKRKREAASDFERYFAGEVKALMADPAARASVPKVWSDWAASPHFNLDATPRDLWQERLSVLNSKFGDYTPQKAESLFNTTKLSRIRSEITSYFGGGASGHKSGQYGAELIRPRLIRNKMDAEVAEFQELTEWGLLNVVSGKASLSPGNDALVRQYWDADKGTFRLTRTTDRFGKDPRKYIEGYTREGLRDMVGTSVGRITTVAGGGGVVYYIEVPANQVFSGWIFGHGAGGVHGSENEFLVHDARVDQIVAIVDANYARTKMPLGDLMKYNGPVVVG